MKGFLLGAIVGACACKCVSKMKERGYFDCMCDDVNDIAYKAKQKFHDAVEKGKSELNNLKDKTQCMAGEAEQKLDEMTE